MSNESNGDKFFFSMKTGVFIPFVYKGHQVVVHNSTWSPREKIWVDDELVSTRFSFTLKSTHQITVAGDVLDVTFGFGKLMKTLFLEVKHGETVLLRRDYGAAEFGTQSIGIWQIVALALLGGVTGYTAVKFLLLFAS